MRSLLRCIVLFFVFEAAMMAILVTVPSGNVVRHVGQDLTLSCRLTNVTEVDGQYRLTWIIPQVAISEHSSRIRYDDSNPHDRVDVTLFSLQGDDEIKIEHRIVDDEICCRRFGPFCANHLRDTNNSMSDAGRYVCHAQNGDDSVIRQSVALQIYNNDSSILRACRPNHMMCSGLKYCIPSRFFCDGVLDCPDGSDEHASHCGTDPCADKVVCDDGRCLERSTCCDPSVQPYCRVTFIPPCCRKYLASIATSDFVVRGTTFHEPSPAESLQSSITGIVLSCIAFLFITITLLGVVCRRRAMILPPVDTPLQCTNHLLASGGDGRHCGSGGPERRLMVVSWNGDHHHHHRGGGGANRGVKGEEGNGGSSGRSSLGVCEDEEEEPPPPYDRAVGGGGQQQNNSPKFSFDDVLSRSSDFSFDILGDGEGEGNTYCGEEVVCVEAEEAEDEKGKSEPNEPPPQEKECSDSPKSQSDSNL